jgi:hypothetical protein
MKAPDPLDFLAALVVEFGGLVLLLAALPMFGGTPTQGQPAARPPSRSAPAAAACHPWPRASNPTPWDKPPAEHRPREPQSLDVEGRLRERGRQLADGLVQHLERWLEEPQPPRGRQPAIRRVSHVAPTLPRITASTSEAAHAP